MMSPTKPIAPAIVTATAVSSADSANNSQGRRATSTPTDAANASPRASALKSRANDIATTSASTTATSGVHAAGGAERSPISQNSMPRNCASGARERISATTAPQPAATTMPVSSNRVGDQAPRPRASPKTIAVDATAPAKAPAGTIQAKAPSSIAVKAPTAAPPDTPSTYGSASGFLSSTWSSAPASASAPPVANAATARGSR